MNGILWKRVCFLVHTGMFLSYVLPFRGLISSCLSVLLSGGEIQNLLILVSCWSFICSLAFTLVFGPLVLFSNGNIWLGSLPPKELPKFSDLSSTHLTHKILWATASYVCLWAYFHSYTFGMDTHFLHFREFILHCCVSGTFCSTYTLHSVYGVASFYTSCPSHRTWPSY